MKVLIIQHEAKAELDEAIAYFETKRRGLGLDFQSQVEKTIFSIQCNPKNFALYKDTDFRKALVARFPYQIFYLELDDTIWVVSIFHSNRKPDS